jgi:hypothetical protein
MAPDPFPNMVEPSDKATGFFSLPRELRDNIYDMVRQDHHHQVTYITFGSRAAIPEKRLVSRQFKLEYDERAAASTYMYLLDPFDICTFEQFPRLAINLSSLVLNWHSAIDMNDMMLLPFSLGPRVRLPLKARLKTLERLVGHLPQIEDVHVQLEHRATHDLKDVVQDLIACPVLTRFLVRSGESLRDALLPRSTGESAIFAFWTRELGFLIDNTDEDKAKRKVRAARERQEKSATQVQPT